MNLLRVVDLGRMAYAEAYRAQCDHLEEVLAARAVRPEAGRVLLVEHEPVVTVGRRQEGFKNLVAAPGVLAREGIEVVHSDRGGDITYHGPGQLVAYPILDLNHLNLGLHDYMRLLEGAVIAAVAEFGVAARRDPAATGVWVDRERAGGGAAAKVCAMGVRVRRWVSMHGLALNVTTNLAHFAHIVPCGLSGRPVTSLEELLGERCPPMGQVKAALIRELEAGVAGALAAGERARAGGGALRDHQRS